MNDKRRAACHSSLVTPHSSFITPHSSFITPHSSFLCQHAPEKLNHLAEGVETEEQHSQLEALTCEYGQGYLYSMPVDAESALSLIRQNQNAPLSPDSTQNADRSLSRLSQILAA